MIGNLANVMRDMLDSHFNESEGHYHNYMATVSHPQAVALDVAVTNRGTTAATIALDGTQLSVSSGQTLSITNRPFFELRVVSAESSAIDYVTQGIYIRTLETLAKRPLGRELFIWQ